MTNGNSGAFARPIGNITAEEFNDDQEGLTKREYFAAMAMQGVITGWSDPNTPWQEYHPGLVADRAVKIADALIYALNTESK